MKLPIPADWDGESWCRWAVCWPDSEGWEAILRGFVTLPQRGWTWDERTGSILAVQETGREITAANLPLNGVLMACNDTEMTQAFSDIAMALRYLADRQFEKPCCGEGDVNVSVTAGYAGTTTQPVGGNVIPIYGNSPPAELPEGATYPEGFADVEEWQAHKCSVAHLILDGVYYTLAFFGALNITSITTLAVLIGAGIAGILVFPPAAMLGLVGAVFAMFGFLGMFLDLRTQLIEEQEKYICILYEAESVPILIGYLADAFDLTIPFVTTTGPLGLALKAVLMFLFNGDALNQLFDKTANYVHPDADCSFCDNCDNCIKRLNNLGAEIADLASPTDWFGMISSNYADYHAVFLKITGPGSYKVEFQNLTSWTFYEPGTPNFLVQQDAGTVYYAGDVFEDFAAACETACLTADSEAQIVIVSASQFTWESRMTNC